MSTTDDTQRVHGVSGNHGTPLPETEVRAELQAQLVETEARLADALNRLAFREAEIAAFAANGAAQPRRSDLMARVAELEQVSEAQEAELEELKSIAQKRLVELGKTRAKLKLALEKSAEPREGEPKAKPKTPEQSAEPREGEVVQPKAKPKAVEKSAEPREGDVVQPKAKLKAAPKKGAEVRETEPVQAKAKPKAPKKGSELPATELVQAKTKPKAFEAALEQVRSTGLWKVASQSVLAAGKSLGIASKWRKAGTERETLQRHIELLTASDLFNRNWYLAEYPDVATSGINPAQHYLRHGAAEGRDPGPRFSTSKYLKRHQDVARAGINPLLHYLSFGRDERRAIFAADRASAVTVPHGALEAKTTLAAATVFSGPPVIREEASWIRHEALCRRQGRTTLELRGTILGWLPSSAQMVGTDSFASLPMVGAAALFCRMMRLGDAKALGCFEADSEVALPGPDLQGAPLGRHFLPNAGPIDVADAWFASARHLRLRFAKPTPVLRFFQWDRHAGQVVLLSEMRVQSSSGLADVPTVNPLLPILIAAGDAEGGLEGLFLLPFPSLCRGGCHYGELVAGEGGSVMERLLTLSTSLAETWLAGDQGAFAVGRIDVDLANARGSEMIFSRAMQLWLDGCFDVRCRPINGSAIADERGRLYLEQTLGGAKDGAEELSERERAAGYALQLGADAIPSLQAIVARGAPPVGSAGLGASILVDNTTGKARWLMDVARLDAELLENQGFEGARLPRFIPVRERGRPTDELATSEPAHGFALALIAWSDSAASTRFVKSGRLIRDPLARPELSVLCPYLGDESRFATLLDSLRLQTDLTNLEVIVTASSQSLASGTSVEGLLRRFFPDGQVIFCDDGMPPGARLNLMVERARCDRLLVAAGVMLHDPSTIAVLRHVAQDEKAATASCVLRSVAAAGAAGPARLHCAGFYPEGTEEPNGVVAAFARLDSGAALGNWTYPIAANPPPLFMTRETTWRELGGFNETLSEMAAVAIDFAVKATTRRYVHLCTSAVTATVIDEAIAVTPKTISLTSATPPLAWRDVATRSIAMRRLVT